MKFGARSGRSRGDRCVRRLAASRQRVHSGAVTEGAAIKLALRLSATQALRLGGVQKRRLRHTELVPSIDDQSRARTLKLTSLPSKVMSQSRGRGFGQYDSSRLHVRAGPSMDQPAGEAFQRFDPFNFEIFDSIRAMPTTLRPGSFGAVIKLFLWLACSG